MTATPAAGTPAAAAGLPPQVAGLHIGPGQAGDEAGIASVHVGAWQAAYRGIVADSTLDALSVANRAARWAELLQDPACPLRVAKAGGRVLGFVSFGLSREPQASATQGEIWTLYVAPDAWRRGVGAALMPSALAGLAEQGCTEAWVWVLADNQRALRFYERCGFVLQPGSRRLFTLAGQSLAEVALLRPTR